MVSLRPHFPPRAVHAHQAVLENSSDRNRNPEEMSKSAHRLLLSDWRESAGAHRVRAVEQDALVGDQTNLSPKSRPTATVPSLFFFF